jgi:hypothetical protein
VLLLELLLLLGVLLCVCHISDSGGSGSWHACCLLVHVSYCPAASRAILLLLLLLM